VTSSGKNAFRSAASPCLKWPGGKQWLAPLLAPILRHELAGTYREPFIGGGAVFFQLAPKKALLSDINRALINFLCCLSSDPDAIARGVWRLSNTRECYYLVRASNPRKPLSAAARFIYLNRTCWGGIYRTNRRGEFNVPFGDSGRTVCRRAALSACSARLRGVKVEVLDFSEAIARAQRGDVIYADPPYTTRGENNGFVRYNERLFSWEDQIRLARSCHSARRRGAFVAVSGLWHDEVLALYRGWWAWRLERQCDVSRKVSARGLIHEALIFSRKPELATSGQDLLRIN